MRESHGKRMVYMDWATFLQLVGSASDRSEIAADLPSVEPDKPWITEIMADLKEVVADPKRKSEVLDATRARIQAAHKNPPQRKREPNKLKSRGFGK